MRRTLALALLAFALVIATSWRQGAEAQAPAPSIDRIPVRWVDAEEPIGLDSFKEQPEPGPGQTSEPVGPATWGVYLIDYASGGRPDQIHASSRQLSGLQWAKNAVKLEYEARFSGYSSALQRKLTLNWRGALEIDIPSRRTTSRLDGAPYVAPYFPSDALCTDVACFHVTATPSTPNVLISVKARVTVPTAPHFEHYLLGATWQAKRLEGFPGQAELGFRGDGSMLYAFTPDGTLSLVPAQDGLALVVSGVSNYALRDGKAFFAVRRSRTACCLDDFYLYDVASGALRHIGTSELDKAPEELRWDDPGSVTNLTQRVDLGTGVITLLADEPRAIVPDPPPPDAVAALNARYEVSSPETAAYAPRPTPDPCRYLPESLSRKDNQTGVEDVLFECPGGGYTSAQFVDEDTLLLQVMHTCYCDGGGARYMLFKLSSREVLPLTDRNSRNHLVYLSPDRTSILVQAERLKVFNLNGQVVRDYGPAPKGWQFYEAAWSPDGASIAFLLEPENWPHSC